MIQNDITNHYNARSQIFDRSESSIYGLRCVNNWVKIVLFKKFSKFSSNAHVLDLCGGRGGDLLKWEREGARHITLVDVAEQEIKRAKSRFFSRKSPSKEIMTVDFICADVFTEDKLFFSPVYEIVSCQFALHYSNNHEKLLQLVNSALQMGGLFLCTFPDSERIKSRLRDSPSLEEGKYTDSVCHIEFFSNSGYFFSLGESLDKCPEYLVNTQKLVQIAAEHNMYLVESKTFDEFISTSLENLEYGKLWENIVKQTPSQDEWKAICLYRYCVFKKCENACRKLVSYEDCWREHEKSQKYVYSEF